MKIPLSRCGQGWQHRRPSIQIRARQSCCPAVFEKAIGQKGPRETVTIDKSGSNLALLRAVNAERETRIKIRQVIYLNNAVEQDHRAIKRITRPIQRFKDFDLFRYFQLNLDCAHDQRSEDEMIG